MNKNTTKYRDLDPKDIHEAGDECEVTKSGWMEVHTDYVGLPVGYSMACRRPIPEPDSPWIPISAPPTEDDGDERGKVLVRRRDGSVDSWSWANVGNQTWAPHWMRIPPLPEPAPTKNERLTKLIIKALEDRTGEPDTADQVVLDVLNAEEAE